MSSGLGEGVFGGQCGSDDGEGFAGDVALKDPECVLAAVALLVSLVGEIAGAGVVDQAVVRDGP
jgi:hypothetical protein